MDIPPQILFWNAATKTSLHTYIHVECRDAFFRKSFHINQSYYEFFLWACYSKDPSGESFCEANNQPLLAFLRKGGFSYQVCWRRKLPGVVIWWLNSPHPPVPRFCPVDKPQWTTSSLVAFCIQSTLQNDMLTSHRMSHLPPGWLTHLGKFFIIRDLPQLHEISLEISVLSGSFVKACRSSGSLWLWNKYGFAARI